MGCPGHFPRSLDFSTGGVQRLTRRFLAPSIVDATNIKAPLGGDKTGPNPTDRGKQGSKRSILIDGNGVPIGFTLAAANVHDSRLIFERIDSIQLKRPKTKIRRTQHVHADKGYDQPKTWTRLKMRRYFPHICKKRRRDRRGRPVTNHDRYRWRVESTHSWLNQCRGLKTRWEKKAVNYIALCHLSFGLIALKFSWVLG